MNRLKSLIAVLGSVLFGAGLMAQERNEPTGHPGDYFSLHGALELFKKAGNPEEFEKMLNREENNVNNLDLNDDGKTDYIRVVNKNENNVRVFVLQVPLSATEAQDIAVIELEKTGNETAAIQIVGDEDIYGEETIVAPGEDNGISYFNNGEQITSGPSAAAYDMNQRGIFVNVWMWPMVRFVFAPGFHVWISPWSWYEPPYWYRPWSPMVWNTWYPRWYNHCHQYVIVHAPRYYNYGYRVYEPMRRPRVGIYHRPQPVFQRYMTPRQVDRYYGNNGRYQQNRRFQNEWDNGRQSQPQRRFDNPQTNGRMERRNEQPQVTENQRRFPGFERKQNEQQADRNTGNPQRRFDQPQRNSNEPRVQQRSVTPQQRQFGGFERRQNQPQMERKQNTPQHRQFGRVESRSSQPQMQRSQPTPQQRQFQGYERRQQMQQGRSGSQRPAQSSPRSQGPSRMIRPQ